MDMFLLNIVKKENSKISIAFDVGGTLIQLVRDEYAPRYDIISLFISFLNFGCHMYIWSGNGTFYAKEWADKLGLSQATIIEKGSFKPDIAFDDAEDNLGNITIRV